MLFRKQHHEGRLKVFWWCCDFNSMFFWIAWSYCSLKPISNSINSYFSSESDLILAYSYNLSLSISIISSPSTYSSSRLEKLPITTPLSLFLDSVKYFFWSILFLIYCFWRSSSYDLSFNCYILASMSSSRILITSIFLYISSISSFILSIYYLLNNSFSCLLTSSLMMRPGFCCCCCSYQYCLSYNLFYFYIYAYILFDYIWSPITSLKTASSVWDKISPFSKELIPNDSNALSLAAILAYCSKMG